MIEIKSVSKSYGQNQILRDVDLLVSTGEHISIRGGSGVGKTTILRLITGFELPDSGDILLNGRSVIKPYMSPYKRGIGFTFQENALFPNMNVDRNISFPIHGKNKHDINERQTELMDALELTGLEKRDPSTLSGGQAKRVELARALASKPKILLLDEPLSNIEKDLREKILCFILKDIKKYNATLIYVSHEDWELDKLGGHSFLIREGRFSEC